MGTRIADFLKPALLLVSLRINPLSCASSSMNSAPHVSISPSSVTAISEIKFSTFPTVNLNSPPNSALNSHAFFLIGGATAPEE